VIGPGRRANPDGTARHPEGQPPRIHRPAHRASRRADLRRQSPGATPRRPAAFRDQRRRRGMVLPGGLTRVPCRRAPRGQLQSRCGSKDTWVLADETLAPTPPVPRLDPSAAHSVARRSTEASANRAPQQDRGRPMSRGMLSRLAELLYWTGRYVERADDTSRIVDAYIHRIARPVRRPQRGVPLALRDPGHGGRRLDPDQSGDRPDPARLRPVEPERHHRSSAGGARERPARSRGDLLGDVGLPQLDAQRPGTPAP